MSRFFNKLPNYFPKWSYHSIHSPVVYDRFSFSISSPAPGIVTTFSFGSSGRCVVIFRHGLIWISLRASDIEHCCHVLICHLHSIFSEKSFHVFCLFSNWIVPLFNAEFWEFFINSKHESSLYIPLSGMWFANVFLTDCSLSCCHFNGAFHRVKSLNFNEIKFIDLFSNALCFFTSGLELFVYD